MTRALLSPLELLYRAGLRAKNLHYERKPPQRLQCPVVSVGNLSVGGSGKTPVVIRLAQILGRQGWNVDVLSRGYGRDTNAVERVDAAGDARRFGDEPLMIARAIHAPVFVGASRYEAGQLAEREGTGRRVHLLDDGFQHRQLARTVDMVVIHPQDLGGRLLPAGRLREPLASLARADVIVLRSEDAELIEDLKPYLRGEVPFWRMKRGLVLPEGPKRAVAFCAIARPSEFLQSLAAAGAKVVASKSFRDHHRYTPGDVNEISKLCTGRGGEEFVTTEKDAVKLDAGLREQLARVAPLRIARLSVEFEEESAVVEQLLALLGQYET